MRWGRGSCLFADEVALPLHRLLLSARLSSTGLHSLPPLMSASLLKGRPVFDHDAAVHGGTVVMAGSIGAFATHGVVVMGASRAPTPRLLGEGRPEPSCPLVVMWNSLMESSIMAHHGDGDPCGLRS
jgi:hypothetical protein